MKDLVSPNVESRLPAQGSATPVAQAGAPRPTRRPYARPRIESGDAFERVQLTSSCNSVLPGDCDPVC